MTDIKRSVADRDGRMQMENVRAIIAGERYVFGCKARLARLKARVYCPTLRLSARSLSGAPFVPIAAKYCHVSPFLLFLSFFFFLTYITPRRALD